MTIFFFFPAQVILSIRILQLWVIDTYIICLIMIVIIKISLWIFFYLSILRVKNREWRDDYANTCFSLQIGLKRIRFHCMINLTWPINVQITILDIQIMFRFSRNINSNLFQLTSPIFSFIRVSLVFVAEIQREKKRRITIIKKKNVFLLLVPRQNQGKFYIF